MNRRISIEWGAFAGGLAVAVIVWLSVHGQFRATGNQHYDAPAIIADKPVDFEASTNTAQRANHLNQTEKHTNKRVEIPAKDMEPKLTVRVFLTGQNRIENVSLEAYVRGVVAAEMPAGFEQAAQQAQALAARTYIVRRMLKHDVAGVPVAGADVTDTQTHQVYRSLAEMGRLRASNEPAWLKAGDAVQRTKGKIIAYEGEPIEALYFSTSNGYTENSEEVFAVALPYLRSVASPSDRHGAPRSEETIEMPIREFYSKLGIRSIPVGVRFGGSPKIKITQWTQGRRVKTMTAGGKTFTGIEVRDKLGLRSASFTWSVKGSNISITTYGSGHGVGMSQWGAQLMAQAGSTAEQIIKHYYKGTELMEVSKLADSFGKWR